MPYFFGGYPVDLIATLRRIGELDIRTIVPGHGEVLSGKAYLEQVIALVSVVTAEVEKELNAGLTKDQVLETAPKNLSVAAYRKQFAGDDKENGDEFEVSFAGLVKTAYNQISVR